MSRKGVLYIKLTVLILTLIVVLAIVFTGFFGRFNMFGFDVLNNSFIDGEATQEQQSFEDIDKIVVYSYSLPVTVRQAERDDVLMIDSTTVSGFNASTVEDNSYKVEQGVLYFEQGEPKNYFFGFNSATVRGEIVFEVPQDVEIEYDISSVSGGILVDAPSKGELAIDNVSGSIDISYGGDDLNINNVSGSIDVMQPFDTQNIKTVSGSIDTHCDTDSTLLRVESVSASIDITLSQGVNYEVKHDSISGSINDSYDGGDDSNSNVLEIISSSVSGSVNIND